MSDAISIRIVRDRDQLQELADSWNSLLARSLNDNIFLTWEWVSTWSAVYLADRELFVVAIFDGDRLVAIAPFWLQRVRTAGIFGTRVLRMLGTGDVCSDHLDVIVQKKDFSRWLEEIWNQLFGPLRSQWDVLEYADVPADSRAFTLFQRFAEEDNRCLASRIVRSEVCPYMSLPDRPDDFLSSLSRTRRYTINYSRKRLSEQGKLTVLSCQKPDQVSDELARLTDLNTRSWHERGQPGSFYRQEFIRFHTQMARRLLELGRLLLCSLWLDDRYLGGFYGFIYGDVLYYYIMSVEKSDLKRVNTGDVLLSHCMEEGIRAGCREFDFLRGDEPYKYRWTDTDRRLLTLRIYNRRTAALPSLLTEHTRQCIRALAKTILRR